MTFPDTDRFVYLPVKQPEGRKPSNTKDSQATSERALKRLKKADDLAPSIPVPQVAPLPPQKENASNSDTPVDTTTHPLQTDLGTSILILDKPVGAEKDKQPKQRVALDSCTLVEENEKDYEIESNEKFNLVYPNGIEIFLIAQPKGDDYNPIDDIYTTVQLIASDCVPASSQDLFGDSKAGIVRNIVRACHKKNFENLKLNLIEFNSVMSSLKEKGTFVLHPEQPASPELILHCFNQAYARSIAPHANQLNKYQGIHF